MNPILHPNEARAARKEARRREIAGQGVTADDILALLAEDITMRDIERRKEERLVLKQEGGLQAKLEERYQKMTTRALLAELACMRGASSGCYMAAEWWAVKKVLATRPHVWRGAKHRAWRSRLAQKQHGQGKSRNR